MIVVGGDAEGRMMSDSSAEPNGFEPLGIPGCFAANSHTRSLLLVVKRVLRKGDA